MNKKILVVDDSYFFREQMNLILTKAGYDVIKTGLGEDALSLVRSTKPDLVVLDVVLPDMDGFTICKTLRDFEGNNLMPIILLTSKDDQDDKLKGLELGADDYITKPFDERELLSRIRNTLRRIDRNRSANPLTGLRGNLEMLIVALSRTNHLPLYISILIILRLLTMYMDLQEEIRQLK